MILTVTITPCIDRSIFVDKLTIGKIIRVNSSKEIIGGKGVNASRLINNLGKKTLALVAVGGLYGKKVCKLIKEQDGFSFEPIWISGETKIINTVLDKSNNVQTAYIEPTPILTDVDKNKIFKTYLKHLPKAKIVVLSGSVAEGKHSNIFQEMIVFARKRNIRAILDSRGSALTLGIKAKPFMVKPNVEEAGNILGKEINKTSDYWKCIDYCISLGIELVVLTRGEKSVFVGYNDKRWEIIPPKIKEVNPVGSGDALVGGISASILDGKNIEHSVKYGVAAGTMNTGVWDACYCKKKDIDNLFKKVKLKNCNGNL